MTIVELNYKVSKLRVQCSNRKAPHLTGRNMGLRLVDRAETTLTNSILTSLEWHLENMGIYGPSLPDHSLI